jgi:hypothetical protein
VVLIVTVSAQAIFFIISRMAGHFFIGMNLFDVVGRVLLVRSGMGDIVTGAAVVASRHGGQWKRERGGSKSG